MENMISSQIDETTTLLNKDKADQICAVICTHNRSDVLRRALHSLTTQTVMPDEVLVIDNAPGGPDTKLLVQNEFPTVRYVEESAPGLDFARNRALKETSKEIVAFMDDDAVAKPSWILSIKAVFLESKHIAICTGKVEAYSLETAGARLFEANGGFARGNTRIHLPRDRKKHMHGIQPPLIAWSISMGSGCSLALRRQMILGRGGFD